MAQNAYITNFGSNTVSVIDLASDTVIETIAVGRGPYGVATSRDGHRVYITNFENSTVSVIDTASLSVVGTILVGHQPSGLALTPDDSRLYVTNRLSGTVSVVNTLNNQVIQTITDLDGANGITISPDGSKFYVSSQDFGTKVYNAYDHTFLSNLSSLGTQSNIESSLNGENAYTVSNSSTTFLTINTLNQEVLSTSNSADPAFRIKISKDGKLLYLSIPNRRIIQVYDLDEEEFTASIPVNLRPTGLSLSPDGNRLYVVNTESNNVSVIDTATNTVIKTISVGYIPYSFGEFITPAQTTPHAIPSLSTWAMIIFGLTLAGGAMVWLPRQSRQTGRRT
ncbi:beta-propeller fold lactonase family protein [Brevundimonas vesicularis]|uniref:YVTN family beta-propeller repeat protein n=1 Tax=Brevundimonas vesicularis TaxID=41276 RepID=UPI0038D4C8C0